MVSSEYKVDTYMSSAKTTDKDFLRPRKGELSSKCLCFMEVVVVSTPESVPARPSSLALLLVPIRNIIQKLSNIYVRL